MPAPEPLLAAAEEAHALLERMTGHCRAAARALEAGDLDAMEAEIEAREPLAARAGARIAELVRERERLLAGGTGDADVAALLTGLEAGAARLGEADRHLRLRLEAGRSHALHELDRTEGERSVLAAYGLRAASERGSIDCRR